MRLNANSIMPYGKYQGRTMADVPADYLIWLRDNGKCSRLVAAYVEEYQSSLEAEAAEIQRLKSNRARMRTMYK